MSDVNTAQSSSQKSALPPGIGRKNRAALMVVGLASWIAGATASFTSGNGAGTAALVGVGAACGVLALMGRWPSRISISGSEVSWEGVKETVDSQIEVVKASGETQDVLAELEFLRQRLDVLQRTGAVPQHPAEVYDQAVEAAIRRLLPGAEIIREKMRSRERADFAVSHQGERLYVETKWKSDPSRPFRGSTLPRLLENLPTDAKLLVVVNTAVPPEAEAYKIIDEAIGGRGRAVAWRDVRDDGQLGRALASLLEDTSASL